MRQVMYNEVDKVRLNQVGLNDSYNFYVICYKEILFFQFLFLFCIFYTSNAIHFSAYSIPQNNA